MKTINLKRIMGAAMLMFAAIYASATEPVISVTGQKKIAVKIENISENTNLVVKDMNGYAFYKQTIEKSANGYVKIFDLTTLPDGNYQIEIEGSTKFTTFPIQIVDNKISSSLIAKTETFKPTIFEKGDKIIVSKFNPENKPLSVTIYNSNGDAVYQETLEGKLDLARIYNFSKAQGNYTISMQSDDKSYTKTISIQK